MSTPIFERIRVRLIHQRSDLLDIQLESPGTGAAPDGFALTIAGWAVGRAQPVTRLQIVRQTDVLWEAPVERERPDIAARFPEQPWASRAGFASELEALTLDPVFNLRLRAVLADGTKVSVAVIRGRRRARLADYQPRFQPLMVTSLGRTGSTWLMRLLAEHPGVLTYRAYPYEVRPAKYWLHLFRVLSARPNPAKVVGQPREFHLETLAAGSNPFRAPAFEAIPELEAWSDSTYVERLAAFCQQSIDEWYDVVATVQGETAARYFAEKQFPDEFSRFAWSLYPGGRELILVRDFRDMVTSMLAYNQKRGFDDFGRPRHETDEAWVKSRGHGVNALALAWQRRADRAHLVRYEDLIADPAATMTAVFQYLELDASSSLVERIVRDTTADQAELTRHQTTRDPAASIGRWHQDLPPRLQTVANKSFHRALAIFGYDTD